MPSTSNSLDTRADLLRLPEALKLTGHSRTSFLNLVREGEIPAPVRIGKRAVAWRRGELLDWVDGLPRAERRVGRGKSETRAAA